MDLVSMEASLERLTYILDEAVADFEAAQDRLSDVGREIWAESASAPVDQIDVDSILEKFNAMVEEVNEAHDELHSTAKNLMKRFDDHDGVRCAINSALDDDDD